MEQDRMEGSGKGSRRVMVRVVVRVLEGNGEGMVEREETGSYTGLGI